MQESNTAKVIGNIALALGAFALGSFLSHTSHELEKIGDRVRDKADDTDLDKCNADVREIRVEMNRKINSLESEIRGIRTNLKLSKSSSVYTSSFDDDAD